MPQPPGQHPGLHAASYCRAGNDAISPASHHCHLKVTTWPYSSGGKGQQTVDVLAQVDQLPKPGEFERRFNAMADLAVALGFAGIQHATSQSRSEEHTSELQSRPHLVCRLL